MINQVVVEGRVTSDIELKVTETGKECAGFTVALNKVYFKDGEKKTQTTFVPVWAFGSKARFVSKNFRKGAPVAVIGKLSARKNKNGGTYLEVVADEITFTVGSSKTNGEDEDVVSTMDEVDEPLPFDD